MHRRCRAGSPARLPPAREQQSRSRPWRASFSMEADPTPRPCVTRTRAARLKGMTQKATFAAGCFWGVEAAFRRIPGVTDTRVGYTGGHTEDPSYYDVCGDTTGHA